MAELKGTPNFKTAAKHGFKPVSAAEATAQGDVIQILLPDEVQSYVYKNEIAPNLTKGKAIGFRRPARTAITVIAACRRAP